MRTCKAKLLAAYPVALALLIAGLLIVSGGCPSANTAGTGDDGTNADVNNDTSGDGNGDSTNGDVNDNGDADGTSNNGDDSGNGTADGGDDVTDDDSVLLVVTVEGNGSVEPNGGEFEPGELVQLTAQPAAGWRFDRWEGDVTGGENPVTITMDADKTVTAVFLSFGNAGGSYYAVFDKILDTDELGDPFNIHLARMANAGGGGNVFVVNGAGDGNDRKGWVIQDLAGISRTGFDLPDGVGQIRFLAVSGNGLRAFMSSGYEDEIYKWEGGGITTIDVSGTPGPGQLARMETTATGDKVFLLDDYNIWRVNEDGTGLTQLVQANTVPVAYGTGYRVWDMDVDENGLVMPFLLYTQTPTGNFVELFVWANGVITQLTDDRTGFKAYLHTSPENGAIVYQDQATLQYVFIHSDGTGRKNLGPAGHNFGGMAFDRTGSTLVYDDSGARGGKRITTSNGKAFELMPYTIPLSITEQLCVSETGTLMFIYRWSSSPLKQGVYIGRFATTAVSDKPNISHPSLSPMQLSRTPAPGAEVALEYLVSDPDGLDDVVATCADEMVDGAYIGEGANSPATFHDNPHDDGLGVDRVAGDGWFTTAGVPGGKVNDYNLVVIRVGAQDASGTIVLTDVEVPIVP